MAQVKVKTLTPVHIGSGKELMEGFGYVYFPNEQTIAVIDDKKVVDIIGTENIDNWTNLLLRNDSLLNYLKQRKPDLKSRDVASRLIKFESRIALNRAVIREQINTLNQPYLPGSSLKGSIKTAVFASDIIEDKSLFYINKIKQERGRVSFKDTELLKDIFGNDPNHDYFKLLQITDVLFGGTICLQAQIFNTLARNYEIKKSISQFVECLPSGAEGICRINIGELQLSQISGKGFIAEKKLNKLNLGVLFQLVNKHTKDLINKELGRWEDKELPGPAAQYCENLEKVLSIAEKCEDGKSCVLRLGYGSGFRFMTGDLSHLFSDDDYAAFEQYIRKGGKYSDFELPKTRRITEAGVPLGFVSLTLQD